ncbi:MAG TPA: prepilin-type N-terminal cleavage/methylation domain-containing protein [Opitutaceae bacterium]|jgi:general secretion pathway protein H
MGRPTTSRIGERGGFTLLEILLALAIIGLMATVLVGGSARLLEKKPQTPEQVFWAAVLLARKSALQHQVDVRLSFDDQTKTFVIDTDGGLKKLPLTASNIDVQIVFLAGQAASSNLLPGTDVGTTLPAVTFYGDGTCTPFRLDIKTPFGSNQVAIDPWTCAKMLPSVNANGA